MSDLSAKEFMKEHGPDPSDPWRTIWNALALGLLLGGIATCPLWAKCFVGAFFLKRLSDER
jgi:hypothetical protein